MNTKAGANLRKRELKAAGRELQPRYGLRAESQEERIESLTKDSMWCTHSGLESQEERIESTSTVRIIFASSGYF